MPKAHKIFIGGGGDDWISNIVKNYKGQYELLNPTFKCRYHSWTDPAGLRKSIDAAVRGDHVTVVGHSYGGDTAFAHTVPTGRTVDVLISIDPVAMAQMAWTRVRSCAPMWLNVRAEPSPRRRGPDDVIADIGGRYPRPPEPGKAGAPNYSIVVDATHGDFRTMMRATSNGVSGRSLLGGNSVP